MDVSEAAKNCMGCGMPMTRSEDFGGGTPANLYCMHCSNPDGSLKSYDEVLVGMVNFAMASQNMDRATATRTVKEYISKMPSWKISN